jgi:hypothetical protein
LDALFILNGVKPLDDQIAAELGLNKDDAQLLDESTAFGHRGEEA